MGIACITPRTYFNHQKAYLMKAVNKYWDSFQTKILSQLAGKPLNLAGDARCDSMGHSAKYSSYSLMDVDRNKVISVQLIQVCFDTSNHKYNLLIS